MPGGGPLGRDSLLQRSKILFYKKKCRLLISLGGNGLDFFQGDPLTTHYLQQTSPSSGLPIAVRKLYLSRKNSSIIFTFRLHY